MLVTYKSSQGFHQLEDVIFIETLETMIQCTIQGQKPTFIPYSKVISIQ